MASPRSPGQLLAIILVQSRIRLPARNTDIKKPPIRLRSFAHDELQHSFAALGDGEIGTGASQVGLQPLASELAHCVALEQDT